MHLRSGEEIGFEKLVVATGAQVRTLDIPGSDLAGVYYLRTLEDSKRIRQKAGEREAGGCHRWRIHCDGSELRCSRKKGSRRRWCCPMIASGSASSLRRCPGSSRILYGARRAVRQEHQGREVDRRRGVKSAVLQNGEIVPCDMVVAGIGVRPVTEPLVNSGIEVADGVVVNEYLETNQR